MQLAAYLDRIGYAGTTAPTLTTLIAVHRAQAASIPYEGLDIQLGRALDLQPERIFRKLVEGHRGGWCYETNGLLGWALAEMGFQVQRVVAGVHRRERGDSALGNHLTLLVDLGQVWLCDLGLGDGLRAPVPLVEGSHHDGPLTFRLEPLADGFWRFHNHAWGSPESFDFRPGPADEAMLEARNQLLQTDPESHFVLNAEAVAMQPAASVTLLGRVLREASATGVKKTLLASPEEMEQVLAHHFDIRDVPVHEIWPRITARHEALFGAEP